MSNIRIENVTFSGGFTFDVPPPPPPPTANFTASPTSGLTPLNVSFTDTSTGNPTSWLWDFKNDGTATSTQQNPTYTYTQAGTYSVKLTATNASGSNTVTKTNLVTATPTSTPTFFVVGRGNDPLATIAYSSNGTNWNIQSSNTNFTWGTLSTAAYDGANTIVIGSGTANTVTGGLRISNDRGNTWVKTNMAFSTQSLAYGNGKFVGTFTSGAGSRQLRYSSTGEWSGAGWANASGPNLTTTFYNIAYLNNRFIGLNGGGSIYGPIYSDDGVNWSQGNGGTNSQASSNCCRPIFDGTRYVTINNNDFQPYFITSDNGIDWERRVQVPVTGGGTWNAIAYGNGVYIVVKIDSVGTSVGLSKSTDGGVTWTGFQPIVNEVIFTTNYWRSVAFADGKFVVTGRGHNTGQTIRSDIIVSSDGGNTWSIPSGLQNVTLWNSSTNEVNIFNFPN